MTTATQSGATAGHLGARLAAGLATRGARRRVLLVATAAFGMVLLGASLAYACTTYWGQTTIENLSNNTGSDSGEFTVVADPTSGMDRCDDANADGNRDGQYNAPVANLSPQDNVPDANNGVGNSAATIRVEISKWEPGDEDSGGNDCEASSTGGDVDDDGNPDHSLASPTPGAPDVWVNTYANVDGSAYTDANTDGVYDDTDWFPGLLSTSGNETNGQDTRERTGDCMGSGSTLNVNNPQVNNQAGPIPVNSDGQFSSGDSEVTANGSADADGDGVNDVDFTLGSNTQKASGGVAGAVCVSQGSAFHSAPQVPLEIT